MANIYYTQDFSITCTNCKRPHSITESQSFCLTCGHSYPLQVNYKDSVPYHILPNHLKGLRLYSPTSLVRIDRLSEKYGADIFAKCEFEFPTGSFKHRGSIVEVWIAKALGYKVISCASTGNMGVSLASQCAKHGLHLVLTVPKTTPHPKLMEAEKFGAELIYVDGSYSICEKEAAKYATENNAFLAGDYYLRAEGAKLIANELLDQLNFELPDIIIVPGGVGTNASAICKGFEELRAGGLIPTLPTLGIVQSTNCCPIIDSLESGTKIIAKATNTLCSATAVANPYDFVKVQRYINLTSGFGIRVSDTETVIAAKNIAQLDGIDCELSGAMPIAALDKIKERIKGKKVVLVITGAGYKDLQVQADALVDIENHK